MKKKEMLILGIVFVLICCSCFLMNERSKTENNQTETEQFEDESQLFGHEKKNYNLETFVLNDDTGFFVELFTGRYDYLKYTLYDFLYENDIDVKEAAIKKDSISYFDEGIRFLVVYDKDELILGTYYTELDEFGFSVVKKGEPGRTNNLVEVEE